MIEDRVIVDTGPLIALLVAEDRHHAWVLRQLETLRAPFLTCEAVLTETFHLLRRVRHGSERFFELLDSGLLAVSFDLLKERQSLGKLVRKYHDLPMSLADACLVRMAEINDHALILTLDSHFGIYRAHGRKRLDLLMPR